MTSVAPDAASRRDRVSLLSWILLTAAIVTVVWVRVRLLSLPLERDEGEYAYIGQWLLRGVPPYESGASMKFPGVFLSWALMLAVFGESLQSIRLAVLVIDLLLAAGIFAAVRRFASPSAARVSAASLLLLLADSGTLALYGHATRFVVAGVVLALLFMTSALRSPAKAVLVGASFAFALLAKQHAIPFVIFGGWWLLIATRGESLARRVLHFLLYALGVALPLGAVALWLYAKGVLQLAWFWTVEYASAYTGLVGARGALANLEYALRQLATGAIALWLVGLVAAVIVWSRRAAVPAWVFPLLLLSSLTVVPGLQFREHYFLTMIPAIAIVTGLAVDHAGRRLGIAIAICLAAALSLINQRSTYFFETPAAITRKIYPTNPFAESIPIGEYIAARTAPGERIAVLGSEPQIYFYSGRRSASRFIYMYPLLERHAFALQMQRELCDEIRRVNPKYIVAVNVASSWLGGSSSPKLVFECLNPYIRENYALAGVVDMDKPESAFVWGDAARRYKFGTNYVLVFERKQQ